MLEQHQSPLLTIIESAEYLGVSRSSIYRLISEEKIETVRVLPRKQHITRDALDNYIHEKSGKNTKGVAHGFAQ